jgi:hypothetical protein
LREHVSNCRAKMSTFYTISKALRLHVIFEKIPDYMRSVQDQSKKSLKSRWKMRRRYRLPCKITDGVQGLLSEPYRCRLIAPGLSANLPSLILLPPARPRYNQDHFEIDSAQLLFYRYFVYPDDNVRIMEDTSVIYLMLAVAGSRERA